MSETKLLRNLDMKTFKSITLLLVSFSFVFADDHSHKAPVESDYYPITTIPLPEGEVIEVSGIDILPGNKVAIASRRGDIFVGEGVWGDNPNPKWTLYARGLHETLGISWKDGWLYATQRPEVTRMKDRDGDGRADVFETVTDDWGINGNYHEYAFGTRHDKNGDIWVVLCLTGSGGADDNSPFRGWCMRVTEEGECIPTGYGIRSPGGIGINHLGDVFYCDNQGLWNGSSSLKHLRPGGFQETRLEINILPLPMPLGPNHRNQSQVAELKLREKNCPILCLRPSCFLTVKWVIPPQVLSAMRPMVNLDLLRISYLYPSKPTPKSFAYFLRKLTDFTRVRSSPFLRGLVQEILWPVSLRMGVCLPVAPIVGGVHGVRVPFLFRE